MGARKEQGPAVFTPPAKKWSAAPRTYDEQGGTLSEPAPNREQIKAAEQTLDSLPSTSKIRDIFPILQQVLPVVSGYFESFSETTIDDPSASSFTDNEEMVATIMEHRASDDKLALNLVVAAPPGHFITEDAISEEDWRNIDGYQALQKQRLGNVGAMKIERRATHDSTEHQYITLMLSPDIPRWTSEQRAALLALAEPLRRAFQRISMPLLRRETVLLQVADEQQLGLVVLDERGDVLEANRRGWVLAREAAKVNGWRAPDVLTSFVEQVALPLSRVATRKRCSLSREDRLEIWSHRLEAEPHRLVAPRTILVLRREPALSPEWSSHAEKLTPKQREIAEALASPESSVSTIASSMKRSPRTVEKHLEKIYERFRISSRSELMILLRGR